MSASSEVTALHCTFVRRVSDVRTTLARHNAWTAGVSWQQMCEHVVNVLLMYPGGLSEPALLSEVLNRLVDADVRSKAYQASSHIGGGDGNDGGGGGGGGGGGKAAKPVAGVKRKRSRRNEEDALPYRLVVIDAASVCTLDGSGDTVHSVAAAARAPPLRANNCVYRARIVNSGDDEPATAYLHYKYGAVCLVQQCSADCAAAKLNMLVPSSTYVTHCVNRGGAAVTSNRCFLPSMYAVPRFQSLQLTSDADDGGGGGVGGGGVGVALPIARVQSLFDSRPLQHSTHDGGVGGGGGVVLQETADTTPAHAVPAQQPQPPPPLPSVIAVAGHFRFTVMYVSSAPQVASPELRAAFGLVHDSGSVEILSAVRVRLRCTRIPAGFDMYMIGDAIGVCTLLHGGTDVLVTDPAVHWPRSRNHHGATAMAGFGAQFEIIYDPARTVVSLIDDENVQRSSDVDVAVAVGGGSDDAVVSIFGVIVGVGRNKPVVDPASPALCHHRFPIRVLRLHNGSRGGGSTAGQRRVAVTAVTVTVWDELGATGAAPCRVGHYVLLSGVRVVRSTRTTSTPDLMSVTATTTAAAATTAYYNMSNAYGSRLYNVSLLYSLLSTSYLHAVSPFAVPLLCAANACGRVGNGMVASAAATAPLSCVLVGVVASVARCEVVTSHAACWRELGSPPTSPTATAAAGAVADTATAYCEFCKVHVAHDEWCAAFNLTLSVAPVDGDERLAVTCYPPVARTLLGCSPEHYRAAHEGDASAGSGAPRVAGSVDPTALWKFNVVRVTAAQWRLDAATRIFV